MKKVLAGIALAIGIVAFTSGIALATPALPSTTSWTNAGLQEMVRFSGPISVSIDGAGFNGQTGTIDVAKPANSTVIAAYLTSAVTDSSTTPPAVLLGGQAVTFTHHGSGTLSTQFNNHFADVTAIVKPVIDAAAAGTTSLALDEGVSAPNSGANDGEELVVIFDNPAKPASSVIIMFGASRSAGDTFAFNFPAITDLNAQVPYLSVGIGFSYQVANRAQQSDIKLSTTSHPTLQQVSVTAGGQDDGAAANGALITVGGVGDSADLPGLTATSNDDEYYGLSSFLSVGDTNLTLNTQNASGDDNLFEAVLYFEGVQVTGATVVGSAPTVFVGPAPTTAPAAVTPTLAATGVDLQSVLILVGSGLSLLVLGAGLLIARRKALK